MKVDDEGEKREKWHTVANQILGAPPHYCHLATFQALIDPLIIAMLQEQQQQQDEHIGMGQDVMVNETMMAENFTNQSFYTIKRVPYYENYSQESVSGFGSAHLLHETTGCHYPSLFLLQGPNFFFLPVSYRYYLFTNEFDLRHSKVPQNSLRERMRNIGAS
uniref:Uncharacterized protein n=1 Tax=Caenorhabditis japonica TaxID=281687 RepID=A0A8R1I5F6_CAEJA